MLPCLLFHTCFSEKGNIVLCCECLSVVCPYMQAGEGKPDCGIKIQTMEFLQTKI
jgi:hypothetical protein